MWFMSVVVGTIGFIMPQLIIIHTVMPECSVYMLVQTRQMYGFRLYCDVIFIHNLLHFLSF